jgi:hypothetical protein
MLPAVSKSSSGFPIKTLHAFHFFPMLATRPVHLILKTEAESTRKHFFEIKSSAHNTPFVEVQQLSYNNNKNSSKKGNVCPETISITVKYFMNILSCDFISYKQLFTLSV